MMTLPKTLAKVSQSLRKGTLSVTELCEKCITRLEKTRELNAFVTETTDRAKDLAYLAEGRYSKNELNRPLDGIPIAVKDNFCTEGILTSCASNMLKNYIPPYNATVVQKLMDEGCLMMGKTNLDEFAMGCGSIDSIYGPVKNPWKYEFREVQEEHETGKTIKQSHTLQKNHETEHSKKNYEATSKSERMSPDTDSKDVDSWYIAGGSSGGSAVAVATGAVYLAMGSDTGGSVRNPASYNGVVGLKPTYGLVSRHGLIPLVNSLDVPGILTRCVDDAALALNVLAGHDVRDSTTVSNKYRPVEIPDEEDLSVKGLTIGIPKEYHAPGLSLDTVDTWRHVADILENAGAKVIPVSLPHTQYSIVCYSILCACEVASNKARYDGIEYGLRAKDESSTENLYAASRHAGFNDVVRGRVLAGNYFLLRQNYDKYFLQAQRVRRLISQDFQTVFHDGVDLLLTPTVLSDAPKYSLFSNSDNRTTTAEQDVFTQSSNLAGIPAITVPSALSSNGLPIGLQLLGNHFQEEKLLSVAKFLENQIQFPHLDLAYLDTL